MNFRKIIIISTSNCKFDRKRKKKDIYVTYKVKFLACSRNDDANALMQRVNEIIINIIRDNYHHLTLLFSRKIPPIPLDIYFLYRYDRNPLLKTKIINKKRKNMHMFLDQISRTNFHTLHSLSSRTHRAATFLELINRTDVIYPLPLWTIYH